MPSSNKAPLKPLEVSVFGGISRFILAFWDRIQRTWFRWAELNQHSAWFPFFIAGIVSVDSIIVILPGDVIMALAILSNPGKWKKLAFLTGVGSAIGAFLLYLALRTYGKVPLDHMAAAMESVGAGGPPKWDMARSFFKEYGLASLAIGSLIPLFSWPPVVLAGLSSDQWFLVLVYLLVGRQVRYWLLSFGVREGWAMFTTLRQQAKEKRHQKEELESHARRKPPARRKSRA
jgi:membrane protein DedA with SNARE-associated domain